jgi:phosphoribosylformylglycinamidine synthase
MFPGGFSYGDDTGSGNAFANKIKNNLKDDLKKFIESGKLILGVCNGFQIMTNLGLFDDSNDLRLNVMMHNDSNVYECRWVHIKSTSKKCIFTKNIDITHIPIAHGEGKFYCEENVYKKLLENDQIVFRYSDSKGNLAQGKYPLNPNGSLYDVAGICDKTGKIFGFMPHPERGIFSFSEPNFHLKKEAAKRKDEKIPELIESNFKIFKNAVDYFKKLG